MDVPPADAVMVGDSVRQDVDGALAAGMRAILIHRAGEPHARERELTAAGVIVLRSLRDLPNAIAQLPDDPITQLPNS
jgi:FMN phosphatase YigB (HAD superfamily)